MKCSVYETCNILIASFNFDERFIDGLFVFRLNPENYILDLQYDSPMFKQKDYIVFWANKLSKSITFGTTDKDEYSKWKMSYICDYDLASYSEKDLTKFFTWFKEFNKLYVL